MKLVGKFLCLNMAVGLAACGGNSTGHGQSETSGLRSGSNSTVATAGGNRGGTNAGALKGGSNLEANAGGTNFAPPDAYNWGWHPGDWGRDISGGLKKARDVVGDTIADMDPVEGVKTFAKKQASDYHDAHGNSGSFTDCVVIVAASCAAAAAALGGGPLGAGLGAGGGVAAADLACRSWYP